MRQRSKRCLNKVNRIVVRDRKQKSPILNPKLNTNRNSKTPPKQPKEIKVKAKEDKPQKNTDRKKAVVKKKKSASEQKLFKVKKQKVSEDEIQINENEREVEAQVVTANIQTENEEESKKDIQNDLEDSDESLEEIIKIQSPKVEVNIQEDWKENSGTEEDSEFLTPFEIKRLIKESSQTKEMIIESLVFPSVKNSSKILKQIKEISITSIQEIQNWFQRMIDTERKLRDYEFKSSNWAMKKSISHNKFKYIKPRIRYNSSPYSKDREERSYKANDHHKCPNYLKYIKNPELSNGRFEYSAKGDVEMAHTDNGQSESSRNKSSRDEVIEFNPEKLSDQCSDSNSNKSNQYMILNHDYPYYYHIMNKDLMITGKKIPIYGWK